MLAAYRNAYGLDRGNHIEVAFMDRELEMHLIGSLAGWYFADDGLMLSLWANANASGRDRYAWVNRDSSPTRSHVHHT